MHISEWIQKIAWKELVRVDLPHCGSNQHEVNGTWALRRFFGCQSRENITWVHVAPRNATRRHVGSITFTDVRALCSRFTGRSEWRLYYTGDFLSLANVGDVLLLVRSADYALHGLVFPSSSKALQSARDLLALCGPDGWPADVKEREPLTDRRQRQSRQLLDLLNPTEGCR